MTKERDFKGVWIPRTIWLSKKLTLQEKVMLAEIDSLDNGKKGCYANNRYFADFFGISVSRVSEVITSLEKKGFVTIRRQHNGAHQEARFIFANKALMLGVDPSEYRSPPSRNRKHPSGSRSDPSGKAKDNNPLNNPSNTPSGLTGKPVPEVEAEEKAPCQAIIDSYNQICAQLPQVRMTTSKRRRAVNARITEDAKRRDLEWWKKYFDYVAGIPFLCGVNDREWKADFDWITNESNMAKIIEGKYENE